MVAGVAAQMAVGGSTSSLRRSTRSRSPTPNTLGTDVNIIDWTTVISTLDPALWALDGDSQPYLIDLGPS